MAPGPVRLGDQPGRRVHHRGMATATAGIESEKKRARHSSMQNRLEAGLSTAFATRDPAPAGLASCDLHRHE
jgi:hypothetical protein